MREHKDFTLKFGAKSLKLGKEPVIMGILNVTPDSFSDGGLHKGPYSGLEHTRKMLREGADIIDIGGESTRPEAVKILSKEELSRVLPALDLLQQHEPEAIISIDTYKAEVAEKALKRGVNIVNDVNGLQGNVDIASVVAKYKAAVIIMHNDKKRSKKNDIMDEIKRYFEKSLQIASDAGIDKNRIVLDPGFGFAKNHKENYEIMRRLDELHSLNFPLLIGTSNKSMIGKVLDVPICQRLGGTIATNVYTYNKGAHIFRVHDVKENLNALKIAKATLYGI